MTLILGRRTSLVSNLEQRGAKFIEYSFLDYIPQTRFTFVNYGSMDEKVAIGKKMRMMFIELLNTSRQMRLLIILLEI